MTAAAAVATPPGVVLHGAQAVEFAVVVAAVVLLARGLRVRRSAPAAWALTMFSVLLVILVAGLFPVVDDGSLLKHGYTAVLVCLLLSVPYLLVRFAYSLGAVGRRAHRLALGLTGVQVLMTLVSPRFPKAGEARPAWFSAFVVLVLASWTVQSLMAAVGLWRAGRGQPSVVRHRMRTLGGGAMLLALALLASAGSSRPSSGAQAATTVMGALAICLLVAAFALPRWLAEIWRAADLDRLAITERSLMTALTPTEVAAAIVPAVAPLLGAPGAALFDGRGHLLAAQGCTAEQVTPCHAWLRDQDGDDVVVPTPDGGYACRLEDGWLLVLAGRFSPVFGSAEVRLLDRVGTYVDLALQRCRLFEQEATARRATEAANAELQTLIYSVSHDLRNPIISVLGYLDLLREEHGGQLQDEGEHYLERISVNALYMQSLIQDLLELSRIGRSEPRPEPVDLRRLAESVVQEVRVAHPSSRLVVQGPFPVVRMSPMRARQLLTNLVDNAAKHSPDGAEVTVSAREDGDGDTLVTVADNGRGIPPAYREKAFEVFERLDAAHGDVPGTGMGLPICRRIVESVGGTIVLDGPPAGAGTGTTVKVVLPAAVVEGWSAPSPTEQESVP